MIQNGDTFRQDIELTVQGTKVHARCNGACKSSGTCSTGAPSCMREAFRKAVTDHNDRLIKSEVETVFHKAISEATPEELAEARLLARKSIENADPDELRMVWGTISTPRFDTDGESLDQVSMDYSYFDSQGVLKWEHSDQPSEIIGFPLARDTNELRTIVWGALLSTQRADECWELVQSTAQWNEKWPLAQRSIGWSVEGKYVQPKDESGRVFNAQIISVVGTPSPKNVDTWMLPYTDDLERIGMAPSDLVVLNDLRNAAIKGLADLRLRKSQETAKALPSIDRVVELLDTTAKDDPEGPVLHLMDRGPMSSYLATLAVDAYDRGGRDGLLSLYQVGNYSPDGKPLVIEGSVSSEGTIRKGNGTADLTPEETLEKPSTPNGDNVQKNEVPETNEDVPQVIDNNRQGGNMPEPTKLPIGDILPEATPLVSDEVGATDSQYAGHDNVPPAEPTKGVRATAKKSDDADADDKKVEESLQDRIQASIRALNLNRSTVPLRRGELPEEFVDQQGKARMVRAAETPWQEEPPMEASTKAESDDSVELEEAEDDLPLEEAAEGDPDAQEEVALALSIQNNLAVQKAIGIMLKKGPGYDPEKADRYHALTRVNAVLKARKKAAAARRKARKQAPAPGAVARGARMSTMPALNRSVEMRPPVAPRPMYRPPVAPRPVAPRPVAPVAAKSAVTANVDIALRKAQIETELAKAQAARTAQQDETIKNLVGMVESLTKSVNDLREAQAGPSGINIEDLFLAKSMANSQPLTGPVETPAIGASDTGEGMNFATISDKALQNLTEGIISKSQYTDIVNRAAVGDFSGAKLLK